MNNTGYFLVADLLGFGKIVKNCQEQTLNERIAEWTNLVDSTASLHGINHLQLISDTLFAGAPSTVEGLSGLLSFSRDLLSRGFEKSFPIRGAIVHGEYVFGKLTYGRAVIAAHELEQAQNWIGITCAPDLPDIETLWSLDLVVCYPAPLKRGPMKLHPVVSWPVPPTERLMRLLTGGGLTRGQEVITWELGEKANNTILFRLYQEILHKRKMNCSRFHGSLPAQPIEEALVGL